MPTPPPTDIDHMRRAIALARAMDDAVWPRAARERLLTLLAGRGAATPRCK